MRRIPWAVLVLSSVLAWPGGASACRDVRVFEDRDGDGRLDPRERGMPGVRVSDGTRLGVTGPDGRLAWARDGTDAPVFVIKPAGYAVPRGADGLPDFWRGGARGCAPIGLVRSHVPAVLDVLVFADTQPKTAREVDHVRADVIEPQVGQADAQLGLTLGDVVDDDLTLYPAMVAQVARLDVPWLHAAGNHDMDLPVTGDDASLATFRRTFGPDTFAWEEAQANLVVLDDVVARPGGYIGGLREAQFAFLEAYLATMPKDRLLVLALHIPLFDATPGRETFRRADRTRLFALLRDVPRVMVLSGHSHTQRHVLHGADTGWKGATPLHEYNVGAVSGAFWSGVADATGVPDATMADGTPNGHARLTVHGDGTYALHWIPARVPAPLAAMRLHAPAVLRQGAYPAFGVFANVWMGRSDTPVEMRVDGGAWRAMQRIERADPWLAAENARDDAAAALRGFDRSPEAGVSMHLWRGALPTDLALGVHTVEVRVLDPWRGDQRATTSYRLEASPPR